MTLDLEQFYGTTQFYIHPIWKGLVYTDGVQYLAKKAGAYWLIDQISGALMSEDFRLASKKDPRLLTMNFFTLDVHKDKSATLTAKADLDVDPWFIKEIDFTDFPLDTIDIWAAYNGEGWALMLKTEY